MSENNKYGFVYLWFDRKHKRYYVGCHWGTTEDGYVCSSSWMMTAFLRRPQDFKRRLLKTNLTREQMYVEEQNYLNYIKPEEIKIRYYNLNLKNFKPWHVYPDNVKTIGQKISHSKTGKPVNFSNPTERGRKISEGKRKAFEKRLQETGSKVSEQTRKNMSESFKGRKHTEEWKNLASERMTQHWENGSRKRKIMTQKMNKIDQGKLHSQKLKERWTDPIWAANQKEKLKIGRNRRELNKNN